MGKIDADVVRKAMTQVKTAEVEAWVKEWIGTTLISKRRKALDRWRKKKKTKKVVQESAGSDLDIAVGF